MAIVRRIRLHTMQNGKVFFMSIHTNGEVGVRSEPYDSISNAKRGAHDEYPEDTLNFEFAHTDQLD